MRAVPPTGRIVSRPRPPAEAAPPLEVRPPAPALQHEFPGLTKALAPLEKLPELVDRQTKQAGKSEAALLQAVEKRLSAAPCVWTFDIDYNREGRISRITATPKL